MKIFDTQINLFFVSLTVLLLTGITIYTQGQEIGYKRTSIKTGTGIGINAGQRETGVGLIYSVGLQKSYGKNHRLRLNPNILLGSFRTYALPTDTRDQLYKITSLALNIHFDLIKKGAVSFVTTCGGFINYSRGLLGTGGFPEENNNSSEYFHSLYFGGNVSIGIRIDSKSKLTYEIRPINLYFGNKGFILGFLMFGIDFKFKE
jgi:hypothetical protein